MKFSFIDWLVVLTIVAIIGFALWTPSLECKSKAEKQGLEYDWGLIQGCMVKEDGHWVDYDRMRVMK